ncbi:MAG TPA: GPP34 family phosphoprotein [Streptosporangiaceae bacterium]|nr:GPP34 family phosphoprotein [Streptosporangiaceae bacterium]
MLLAEDLLLLVTDDPSGRLSVPALQADAGLGGANLLELTLMSKVGLAGEHGAGKPGRIVVRDPAPTGDPVLDTALQIVIAHQGSKPSALIRPLGKNLRQTLYERLASSGMVRASQSRILGLFPAHRWPAQDSRHEAEVRQQLIQALVQQSTPDERTAALIALLHALRCEHKIIDPGEHGLSRRQLSSRAKQIAGGNWASEAARRAIGEMTAAVVAAVTSAAVSAGSG